MLNVFIRPLMILIPIALGMIFPQGHALSFLVRWCIIFMIFWSCLPIRYHNLRPVSDHWRIVLANLLMALIPYALLRLCLPGDKTLAETAFFVGIAPTATAAPVVMSFLHGRVEPMLVGFVMTNVLISASLIVLLPLLCGSFTPDFLWKTGSSLLLLTALPMILAALTRRFAPAVKDFAGKHKGLPFAVWSFVLYLTSTIARNYFDEHPGTSPLTILCIGMISLLICAANFWLGGKISSRWHREFSQMLGQKNTTFSICLALQFGASPLVTFGPIFYVLWHNSWNAWQMYSYNRHTLKKSVRRIHSSTSLQETP